MSSNEEASTSQTDNETLQNDEFLRNARNYVWLASKKNRSHQKAAVGWETFFYAAQIFLIILTSLSTILSVMENKIPAYVLPIISGIATIVSSVMGVLKPHDKQVMHLEAARRFKILMLKLVSCEDIAKYKRVRQEIQDQLMDAPFTFPHEEPLTKRGQDLTDGATAGKRSKKQAKNDEMAKQIWAINPILKLQLHQDEKLWEDYLKGNMDEQKITRILKERRTLDTELLQNSKPEGDKSTKADENPDESHEEETATSATVLNNQETNNPVGGSKKKKKADYTEINLEEPAKDTDHLMQEGGEDGENEAP